MNNAMDMPNPPPDINLESKNIIDKLAEFVSRNGQEFEKMTKIKQQGNPKFAFLYGGLYYEYYQYKLRQFQQQQNQQSSSLQQPQQQPPSLMSLNNNNLGHTQQSPAQQIWSSSNNSNTNGNVAAAAALNQIEALNTQQNTLREQIRQSELNLTAQHSVLIQQQKNQIEEAISRAQAELLQRLATENNVDLNELDRVLQPIIDSCTKPAISHGKSWILQHTTDSTKCQIISQYLLKKAMLGGAFTQKLHLIYLINDLLHHCVRKNAEDLKKCLEGVVIPMFCNAQMSASDEQGEKLTKLLSLWESKSNFFDACVISKLKSPPSSIQEYQNTLLTQHASVITPLTQATKATFDNYQQQHQAFVQHATQQIALLENQKQQIEQQSLKPQPPPLLPELVQSSQKQQQIPSLLSINSNIILPAQQQQQQQQQSKSISQPSNFFNNQNQNQNSNNNSNNSSGNSNNNNNNSNYTQYPLPGDSQVKTDFSLPPPNFPIPDLSRPPPGFDQGDSTPEPQEDPAPTIPYFDYPAGLMVPLIKLDDYRYMPLDPEMIRLPQPTPPNERILSAVEAFYAAPSHERPRDGEGWEKLGLYEYFKVKNASKKQKEESILQGLRERSRSPSPIPEELIKPPKKVKKRIYRSKSRSLSRSRSRSSSPEPKPSNNNNHDRYRRRSKSPPQRSSPTKMGGRGSFTRNDSRNDRERRRSVTPPPSFSMGDSSGSKINESIEESNKGHQMLKKMGWVSGGIGGGSVGIAEPLHPGQVRDKQDLYKGVGVSLSDPYENFRKNKGQDFLFKKGMGRKA